MASVYMVMERTFFYTDEVYLLTDGRHLDYVEAPSVCNSPQKLFLDKGAAQNYADKLNIRQFANLQPSDFALSPEEIIVPATEKEFFRRLKAILGDELEEDTEWWDLRIPAVLSDEQLAQVAALFRFVRYIVIEAQADTEAMHQRLIAIIGEEIARCPEMRAFTLPSRLSLDELSCLARIFHLDAITLTDLDIEN